MKAHPPQQMSRLEQFYYLTKPGIIRGNALTATAGFMMASNGHVDLGLYGAMLLGLSLIIACGCVLNNVMDRGIDAKMGRTKNRALVTGDVAPDSAMVYASILGLLGVTVLALLTNLYALAIALGGLFFYVIAYGYAKRRTMYGTLVGSISGAVPPVVGYTAVTNRLDMGAGLLFLMLVCWQMPHFYAIAIYRLKDYKAAGIPVLPAVKGIPYTKVHILLYIWAFIGALGLLSLTGYTTAYFAACMTVVGLLWFALGMRGYAAKDDHTWARQMFLFSLLVILGFCVLLSADSFLS